MRGLFPHNVKASLKLLNYGRDQIAELWQVLIVYIKSSLQLPDPFLALLLETSDEAGVLNRNNLAFHLNKARLGSQKCQPKKKDMQIG
jgi:hypothetical protein